MSTTISPNDLTFDDGDDFDIFDYRAVELGDVKGEGGEDHGRLLIRFDVDGQRTQVLADLGQTGDLAAIEAGLTALRRLHGHLSDLLGDRARAGRCLASGDWGRCHGDHGHKDGHRFRTEAEWRAEQSFLQSLRSA